MEEPFNHMEKDKKKKSSGKREGKEEGGAPGLKFR